MIVYWNCRLRWEREAYTCASFFGTTSLSSPTRALPVARIRFSPFAVSGRSVSPVCRPFRDHSVSPWRIMKQRGGMLFGGNVKMRLRRLCSESENESEGVRLRLEVTLRHGGSGPAPLWIYNCYNCPDLVVSVLYKGISSTAIALLVSLLCMKKE